MSGIAALGTVCGHGEDEIPCESPDVGLLLETVIVFMGILLGSVFVSAIAYISYKRRWVDFPRPIMRVLQWFADSLAPDLCVFVFSVCQIVFFYLCYESWSLDWFTVYTDVVVSLFSLLQTLIRLRFRDFVMFGKWILIPKVFVDFAQLSVAGSLLYLSPISSIVQQENSSIKYFWTLGFLGCARIYLMFADIICRLEISGSIDISNSGDSDDLDEVKEENFAKDKRNGFGISSWNFFLLYTSYFVLWLWCFACLFVLLETIVVPVAHHNDWNLINSIYVSFMTVFRVGLADLSPNTLLTKLIISLLLVITTYHFYLVISMTHSVLSNIDSVATREYKPGNGRDECFYISGSPDVNTLAEFLVELYNPSRTQELFHTVILVPRRANYYTNFMVKVQELGINPLAVPRLWMHHGCPLSDFPTFSNKPRCAWLLPDLGKTRSSSEELRIDSETALIALKLKPHVRRTVAVALSDKNILLAAGLEERDCISWADWRMTLLGCSSSIYGMSTIVSNLVSFSGLNKYSTRHGWSFEYERGLQTALWELPIDSPAYWKKPFLEVCVDFFQRTAGNVVLLGIVSNETNEVVINPYRDFEFPGEGEPPLIGIFMADNADAVKLRKPDDATWKPDSLVLERGEYADDLLDMSSNSSDEDETDSNMLSDGEKNKIDKSKEANSVWIQGLEEGKSAGARELLTRALVDMSTLAEVTGHAPSTFDARDDPRSSHLLLYTLIDKVKAETVAYPGREQDSEDDDDDDKVSNAENNKAGNENRIVISPVHGNATLEEDDEDEQDSDGEDDQDRNSVGSAIQKRLMGVIEPPPDNIMIPPDEKLPPYIIVCCVDPSESSTNSVPSLRQLKLLADTADANIVLLSHNIPEQEPGCLMKDRKLFHVKGYAGSEADLRKMGLMRAKAILVLSSLSFQTDSAVVHAIRLIEEKINKLFTSSLSSAAPIVAELIQDIDMHILVPIRPKIPQPSLPFLEVCSAPLRLRPIQSARWASGQLLTSKKCLLSLISDTFWSPNNILTVTSLLTHNSIVAETIPERWFGKQLFRFSRWLLVYKRLITVALVRQTAYVLEPEEELRNIMLKTPLGNTPLTHKVIVTNPSHDLALQPDDYFICLGERTNEKKGASAHAVMNEMMQHRMRR